MTGSMTNEEFPLARGAQSAPDAPGQASLLLIESLIHGLIGRAIITVADAVEIIDVAMEAEAEIEAERTSATIMPSPAQALLEAISSSFIHDI